MSTLNVVVLVFKASGAVPEPSGKLLQRPFDRPACLVAVREVVVECRETVRLAVVFEPDALIVFETGLSHDSPVVPGRIDPAALDFVPA